MGFPVVFAEIDNLTDSSMTIKLSQWKFSTNSEKDSSSPWNIPVNIKYSNGTKNILMDSVSTTIEIENFKSGDWVLLNSGAD
jgi:aminopeptidase N